MSKNVIKIPPTKEVITQKSLDKVHTLRVCAYCRVSTSSDEQEVSLENQKEAYAKRIAAEENWELVKIYVDDGISGTSDKGRNGFAEMMQDCREGKIDLILCKSISRLSRNTILLLQTVDELKSYGVRVYFDVEKIDTFDEKFYSTLVISSTMAQEQSKATSDYVSWALRKKMDEGFPIVNCTRFLGYDKDKEHGKLIINPEEAEIVKLIFDLYDSGEGCLKICKILQERGIKTVVGGKKWHTSTVTGILRNEKYIGQLKQQKTFTVDFRGHKRRTNTGEKTFYIVEDAHDPIISKEQFERVQQRLELNSIKQIGSNTDRAKFKFRYPLSGTIICYKCGNTFKRRTWNAGQPCQKHAYQCNSYINHGPSGEWCYSQPVSEKLTHLICCDIINTVYLGRSKVFTRIASLIETTLSTRNYEDEQIEKSNLKRVLNSEIEQLLKERFEASSLELKEQIDKRYKELITKYERIDNSLENIKQRQLSIKNTKQRLNEMLDMLNKKRIEPDILTKEMVQTFFYRIIAVNSSELVFVIDATHTMKPKDVIKHRQAIAAKEPIYSNEITGYDPKPTTIKYKVVLV